MSRTEPQPESAVELLSDKYEILEALGDGGMGRVFRARHRQLKRVVAIKLLQHDLGGEEAVARFLREARAAAQITSMHVAHIMDADVLAHGQPYIVMEYLRGSDLAAWLAEHGRMPVTQAVDFVLQALEALAEAHSLQIVHRDLKPSNLFATHTPSGEIVIKVLDFGLAKTSHAFDTLKPGITERGAMLGTPSYMSPEQFVDAQQADARSDIWSLGATLFELIAGVPPFTGASFPQVYRAVMHRSIPGLRSLMPELPQALDDVIATCLTRERELRYADVAELATALLAHGGPSAEARVTRIQRIVASCNEPRNESPAGASRATVDEVATSAIRISAHVPSAAEAASQRAAPVKARPRWPWVMAALLVIGAAAFWLVISRTPTRQTLRQDEQPTVNALPSERAVTRETTTASAMDTSATAAPSAPAVSEPVPQPSGAPAKRVRVPRTSRANRVTVPSDEGPGSPYEQYP